MDIEKIIRVTDLKDVERRGWKRFDIKHVESVADHTFGVAMLALILCPDNLNRDKLVRMALIHDLAEIETDDITPFDKESEHKHVLEQAAMKKLFENDIIFDLWEEYSQGTSEEAMFLKELDKLDMAIQALKYEKRYNVDLTEFFEDAKQNIKTPHLVEALDLITKRR
ncbi:MAG: HD domain-containing protein [Candidatus Diapherotrites archaeon]|nr:HD domain-containing protein [Candidatus Diapherotrites archaeon]